MLPFERSSAPSWRRGTLNWLQAKLIGAIVPGDGTAEQTAILKRQLDLLDSFGKKPGDEDIALRAAVIQTDLRIALAKLQKLPPAERDARQSDLARQKAALLRNLIRNHERRRGDGVGIPESLLTLKRQRIDAEIEAGATGDQRPPCVANGFQRLSPRNALCAVAGKSCVIRPHTT